jgi:two-component system, NtrC family, response regulator AtoC
LLTGETGVGKGVLARFIHTHACASMKTPAGSAEPTFVHVNCSALPATLVEGELFGHEKGAFTDARDARPGLFEMADGGTIFLDEVSETPLEFQAKLLTVLEHGVFRRVGGSKERRVRVRVIAASNQNLEERVKGGLFRRDLLYRLNAFTIKIPSLRERSGDALRIADVMLDRLGRRYARTDRAFSEAAREAISEHPWPGNVRELVNSVRRGVMLSDGGRIEPEDLGLEPAAPSLEHTTPAITPHAHVPMHAPMHMPMHEAGLNGTHGSSLRFDFEHGVHKAADVEKELIMQALRFTRGNVSRAAKLIGMQRSSLRYRIDRYQLEQYVVEVANK